MLWGMISKHRLAEVAGLIADPGRAGMLVALWDGTVRPAGELARIAGVSAATASAHLRKLVAGGALRVEPRGRHRYYRLAGPDVAHALESLARLLPARTANGAEAPVPPLRRARLCYDHLAGRLGVALSDAMLERGWLTLAEGAYALSPIGQRALGRFGIDVMSLQRERRPLLRACIDWTERREHVGGALGAALATQLLERDWLRRERGSRTVLVTSAGRGGLIEVFGLRADD